MTRRFFAITWIFCLCGAPLLAGPFDGITLMVAKGGTPNQVSLQWTGGLPNFNVYRSTNKMLLESPTNLIGITSSRSWTDDPPPGAIFFYEVTGLQLVSSGGNNGLESPGGGCRDLGDDDLARLPRSRNVGDVHLHSGEYYVEQVDLRIKGRGFDFVWKRTYRSREGRSTTMGQNWDHSYNLRLQVSADDPLNFWVYDGTGRRDTYAPAGNGCWTAPGIFNELCADINGTYVLTFPNATRWRLGALDATPAAGLVRDITDRNLNTMTFAYDGAGRLATITDTLNRPIALGYTVDGRIASLTDFVGRTVAYSYYNAGDTGGSAGDLKSWRTPVVTGTPNGNNFPAGKTVTYTYSRNQPAPALDHNLLTITDALGQLVVQNVYTAITNPAHRAFDRLERQVFLDGTVMYFYVAETPSPGNGMATSRTIVRDRALNVREAYFSAANHMTLMREYTGRAPDPTVPTTDTLNRPTARLRASDPVFFETTGVCNSDALRTSVVYPCGDEVQVQYEQIFNPFANRREQANVRYVYRLPGSRGGDQSQIYETFQHQPGFGSCCGETFVTQHVDARGYGTYQYYDPNGNLLYRQHPVSGVSENFEYDAYGQMTAYVHPDNGNNWARRDEFVYDAGPSMIATAGPGGPFLRERRIDVLGRNLITRFERDALGNVTRIVNPTGQDTLMTFNALDQIVRTSSREVSPGGGVRQVRDTFYDANDQVVRVDVENRDANGVIQPNVAFSTSYTFDPLGRVTATRQEVDPTHDVVRTITYEPNGKANEVREGESTAGRQIANKKRISYDERDLEYQNTHAPGSAESSTTQLDYDCNGSVARAASGLEGGTPHIFLYTYDGYDRLTVAQEPMGNLNLFHYDANHNPLSMRFEGEILDAAGSSGNVRLAGVTQAYDPMNRPMRRDLEHFDLETQDSIGDGMSTTLYEYNAASLPTKVTDDNGRVTETKYNTLLDVSETIDAKGNRTTYTYDDNQNLSSVLQADRSDLGGPDQQFLTSYEYDGLDRLRRTTDSSGNATDRAYDSRDNLTRVTDALRTPSPGGAGNLTTFSYDGLNRQLSATQVLTSTGAGGGTPVGTIVNTQVWDDSSRLVQECDGNGRCTRYTYDAGNQVVRIDYADGTAETHVYDVHGSPVRDTDANGTVVVSTYDSMDGLLQRTITPGPGVDGATTLETYQYNGVSWLVRAQNDQSLVTRAYDSLANVIRETINGLTYTATFDGEGNAIEEHYPGGTTLFNTHDELNRKLSIFNATGMVGSYAYGGPDRVLRRDYGNGTRTAYTHDGIIGIPNPPGDFGVQQVTRVTASSIASGVLFDDWSFTWDRVGSRVRKENRIVFTPGQPRFHDFQYDSAYRLNRGSVLDPLQSPISVTDYTLDAAGNRTAVSGPGGGAYTSSATLPVPGDAQMNQYTSTPADTRTYDEDGNLLTKQATGLPVPRTFAYDYANRLVRILDPNAGVGLNVRFVYDTFGRRIEKYAGGAPTPSARYAYQEAQEIEETDAAGTTRMTFVYGNRTDELLAMRRAGTDYYYHADDQGNITALTNAAGAVVERYDYGDFGAPTALSSVGNPYLFNGRRYDDDLGLYYYRARYLEPAAGRFVTRDPLGAWGDATNGGNAFTYVGNNPASREDPTGMYGDVVPDPSSCAGKEQDIFLAVMRSETLARRAYTHMVKSIGAARVCDMRYLAWFGFYKHSRYSTVESGFAGIQQLVRSEHLDINCADARCDGDTALVDDQEFPGPPAPRPDYVALCSGFFDSNIASRTGDLLLAGGGSDALDYRGGVLVHEYSHLRAHTDDLGYGAVRCQKFARFDPSSAIRNADNFEYFSTSPIEGSCSLGTLLTSVVLNRTREIVGSAGRLALRAEKKAAGFLKRSADKVSNFAKRAKKKWKWH